MQEINEKQQPSQDAEKYNKIKNILFFVGFVFDFSLLLVVYFSGLSLQFKLLASQVTTQFFLMNALYVLMFSAFMYILHFPIGVYSGFILEHRFNLSNQSFLAWIKDDLKKGILGLILFVLFIEAVYTFLHLWPNYWWLAAGSFWLLVAFVLSKITPRVIIPLFYKYSTVEDQSLRSQIFAMFKKCKVPLKEIYAIDMSSKTKKANAFICGMGKTRRVVLGDTLVSNFSSDEIEAVVAHELGHYKHHDIVKLFVINAVVMLGGLYLVHQVLGYALTHSSLTSIDDIAFFPMILLSLMIFSFVTMPLLNGFSRWCEVKADQFALEQTRKPQSFISLMEKLKDLNLAEDKPSPFMEWLLFDHPALYRRIEYAKRFNSQEVNR